MGDVSQWGTGVAAEAVLIKDEETISEQAFLIKLHYCTARNTIAFDVDHCNKL